MPFWIFAAFIVSAVLSYFLQRRAASRVQQPGDIQPPEVPSGTPVRVAFGTVKLEPIYCSFDFTTFRPITDAQGPVYYDVTWFGVLCWGQVEFLDILYDEKRYLSGQGTQHHFTIVKHTEFFTLGSAPDVTDTAMAAMYHGGFPDAFNVGYRYAEVYLPLVFGGNPFDGGEGGIQFPEASPRELRCQGNRLVYGASYIFYCGGDFFLGSYLQVPPVDDLSNFGTPPTDVDCNLVPTTSGPGRIQYERFAMVYFSGGVGSSPVLKKQEFIVFAGGGDGVENDDDSRDENPISFLYRLLTNPDWGLGISPALINATKFTNQASNIGTVGEKFGISGVLSEQRPAEEWIDEICRTIDAVMYRHPATGLLEVQCIRADYTLADLLTIDASMIEEIEWTRRDWADTVNEITVAYTDRARLFQRHVVTVQDHANIFMTGGIRSQTFEFPFISTEQQALKVAARELKANTLPLGRGTVRVTRAAWGMVPGDAVVLDYPRYGINALVCRVISASYGDVTDGIIELELVEDLFGVADVPYTVTTPNDDPGATPVDAIQILATENSDGLQGEVVLTVTPNDTVTLVSFITQSGNDPAELPVSVSESPAFTYVSPAVNIDPTYGATIQWTVAYTVNSVATTRTGVSRFLSAAPALISGDAVIADPDNDGDFEFVFDEDGNQVFV